MRLVDLLTSIGEGRIKFTRSEQKGNDTILMWFEKQVGVAWVKMDISDDERVTLLDCSEGNCGVERVLPIMGRLSAVGILTAEFIIA